MHAAIHIPWRGRQAALPLVGHVYAGNFHGRVMTRPGKWEEVVLPMTQFYSYLKGSRPSCEMS